MRPSRDAFNGLLFDAAASGNAAACLALIENGATLDARNSFGRTALHWAAQRGHTTTVTALIENRAALDAMGRLRPDPAAPGRQ